MSIDVSVPTNLLKAKDNIVAVRITSIGGPGKLSPDGSTGFAGELLTIVPWPIGRA